MAEKGKTNILRVRHTTYVLQRLNEQRQRGLFCDAVLIVEGKKFKVHRSFLAANSDYFLSLFTSAEEQHNFVLAGVPLQGFRVILDFIYTSTFVLDLSNVNDVHKASTALNFKHVQAACEKVYVKIRQKKESSAAPQAVSLCKQAPDERNPVEVDQSGDVTQTQHNSKGVNCFHRRSPAASEPDKLIELAINETQPIDTLSDLIMSPEDKMTSKSAASTLSNKIIKKESFGIVEDLLSRPMNLKRKVKSERQSSSPFPEENVVMKRIKNHSPNSCNGVMDSGIDDELETSIPQMPVRNLQTSTSLNALKETKFCDPDKTRNQTNKNHSSAMTSSSEDDSKFPNPCLLKVNSESSESQNDQLRTKWQSEPRLTGKNDGKCESAPIEKKNSEKLLLSSTKKKTSSTTSCEPAITRKEKFEALCSQWKVNQCITTEKNKNNPDTQMKVHRNRRKMFKTVKVPTLKEEDITPI